MDADGNKFDMQPWASRSEGAANLITGMIDSTISSLSFQLFFQASALLTSTLVDDNGSFLSQNAVANDHMHSHVRDEQNISRLWELSEQMVQEKYNI